MRSENSNDPSPEAAAGEGQPQHRYVLRGLNGEVFGRTLPVPGATTLGRSLACGLHFAEMGLSREHAQLEPTEHGVRIRDLGSTNGTYVNRARITEALAEPGDEIQFDQLRFTLLEDGGYPPATDPHPAATAPVRLRSPRRTLAIATLVVAALILAGALALLALGPSL